jgi:hypothetical protein
MFLGNLIKKNFKFYFENIWESNFMLDFSFIIKIIKFVPINYFYFHFHFISFYFHFISFYFHFISFLLFHAKLNRINFEKKKKSFWNKTYLFSALNIKIIFSDNEANISWNLIIYCYLLLFDWDFLFLKFLSNFKIINETIFFNYFKR